MPWNQAGAGGARGASAVVASQSGAAAVATGTDSTAVGGGATAGATLRSTVLGRLATALNDDAVAIGANSQAQKQGTAVGAGAQAQAQYTTAVGQLAGASIRGMAIGFDTMAAGGTALGFQAQSVSGGTAVGGDSFGEGANADAGAVAIGKAATSGGHANSNAIGNGAACTANGQTAIGSTVAPVTDLKLTRAANGQEDRELVLTEEVTLAAGTTVDSTIQIPANVYVWWVSARVTQAITGPANWRYGKASDATPNRYGDTLVNALGTINKGFD